MSWRGFASRRRRRISTCCIGGSKEFGEVVKKSFMPEISQKKREEMVKLISLANSPAREKVGKIKYSRAKDSILNKQDYIFNNLNESGQASNGKQGGSMMHSNSKGNLYSKTMAFGRRDESGGEDYSPSKAYISDSNLEPVREKWRNMKRK